MDNTTPWTFTTILVLFKPMRLLPGRCFRTWNVNFRTVRNVKYVSATYLLLLLYLKGGGTAAGVCKPMRLLAGRY